MRTRVATQSSGHLTTPVKFTIVCNGDHTIAFVAKWEGKCLVSFEGTSGIASFIKVLEFVQAATDWSGCSGCKVHGWFLDECNSVKSVLRPLSWALVVPTSPKCGPRTASDWPTNATIRPPHRVHW